MYIGKMLGAAHSVDELTKFEEDARALCNFWSGFNLMYVYMLNICVCMCVCCIFVYVYIYTYIYMYTYYTYI